MKLMSLQRIVLGFAIIFITSGLITPGMAYATNECKLGKEVINKLDINQLKGSGRTLVTIRKAYRRIANETIVPISRLLADDVTWTVEGVPDMVPFAGTYVGKAGVLRYLEDLKQSVCIDKLYVRYFLAQPNTVNVHLYEEGVIAATGKRFTMEIVHLWRLNDEGEISSFREYNDTFAMQAAFDPAADPALSLVSNMADYGIPTSSYTDTLSVILSFYAALGRADIDFFIQNTDPNLVWILAGPEHITPIAGTFYGVDGLLDFFSRLFSTQQYLDFQVKSILVDGSRADAEFYEEIYVYATGKIYIAEGLHTVIIGDDGKLRSFRSYNDTYSVAEGHTLN